MKKVTLGVIVGNRGFFPDHLCVTGRQLILDTLEKAGFAAIIPPAEATNCGAIESLHEARLCADHFKKHRDQIDGILVTLPNFGDERAIANTIRFAGLDVPVLVHAFQDDPADMSLMSRRDSFCGKMSACNNLRQYGIRYSLTSSHTMAPETPAFAEDLANFGAICRIVGNLRGARIGAIGARPAAFNTVRYSEKLFEAAGISVETLDLSELLGWANRLHDLDQSVEEKLKLIRSYTNVAGVPEESLMKMAKLGAAIDNWMTDNDLSASAIQCWTAMEEFYGVVPCAIMSMMSNTLQASACETDIAGAISMLILQSASQRPAALLDWNNNYGDDPDKGVVFHCSNLPKDVFCEQHMDYQEIIAGSIGRENTYGTICGRIKPGPFTYCRVSTDDLEGRITGYTGEGVFTEDALSTFGGYGVVRIPRFQQLLSHICRNGLEHHVAATLAPVGTAVREALTRYLGWEIHQHDDGSGPA